MQKKSLEKYLASDLSRNTEEMQWVERTRSYYVYLFITFIYYVCGGVSMGKCMMYVLVWTHVPLLLCVCVTWVNVGCIC